MKTSLEIDFHGYTSNEVLDYLETEWVSHRWDGVRRVFIIHGNGNVLWRTVRDWADRRGIQWVPHVNPGVTVLHPSIRTSVSQPYPKTHKILHTPESFQQLKKVTWKTTSSESFQQLKKVTWKTTSSNPLPKPDRTDSGKEIELMKEAFDKLDVTPMEEIKRRKFR